MVTSITLAKKKSIIKSGKKRSHNVVVSNGIISAESKSLTASLALSTGNNIHLPAPLILTNVRSCFLICTKTKA